MKCPHCENEVIEIIKGKDHIFNCPKCGISFCTTTQIDIDNDSTIYELSISPNNIIDNNNITIIKKIFGVFSLEARDILNNGRFVIRGYAYKIDEYIEMLKNSNISYVITPKYPYSNFK